MRLPITVLAILGAVYAATSSPVAAEPLFTDITDSAGIPSLKYGEGAVFYDFDADDLPELFLTDVRGRNLLFKNLGSGKFREESGKWGLTEGGGLGAVAGDFNNDDLPDLYVARGSYPYGTNLLYLQGPAGNFVEAAERAGVSNRKNGVSALIGDFNLDGLPDLFAVNWSANNLFLRARDKEPRFGEAAAASGLGAEEAKSWGAVFADFNDDGYPDLVVARGTRGKQEGCRIYLSQGDGVYRDASLKSGLGKPSWGMAPVAADFNGDGGLDLFITGFDGPDMLFFNDGGGRFKEAAAGSVLAGGNSVGAAAGDINGDLRPDLVVGGFAGPARVYLNAGGGRFKDITAESGIQSHVRNEAVVLADIDGDGDLDLYLANYEGKNRLYRNDLNRRGALKVRPKRGSNPAFGASVGLYLRSEDGRPERLLARQDIFGGSGFCSQSPPEAVFFLPNTGSFIIKVRFPGGRTAEEPVRGESIMTVLAETFSHH